MTTTGVCLQWAKKQVSFSQPVTMGMSLICTTGLPGISVPTEAWASHPSVSLCAAQHACSGQYVCRQKDVLAYEERHYFTRVALRASSWAQYQVKLGALGWTRGGACVDLTACTADDDCAAGETCQNRRCLEPPPECLFDLDCADGFVCEFGSCVIFSRNARSTQTAALKKFVLKADAQVVF